MCSLSNDITTWTKTSTQNYENPGIVRDRRYCPEALKSEVLRQIKRKASVTQTNSPITAVVLKICGNRGYSDKLLGYSVHGISGVFRRNARAQRSIL